MSQPSSPQTSPTPRPTSRTRSLSPSARDTPTPTRPSFAELATSLAPPFAHVLAPSPSVSPASSPSRSATRGSGASASPARSALTIDTTGGKASLLRSLTEPCGTLGKGEREKAGRTADADPPAPDEKARGRSRRGVPPLEQDTAAGTGRLVLEKYTLYETKTKFYIIASNQADSRYRVLKVDRSPPPEPRAQPASSDDDEDLDGLIVTEDATIYSKDEIRELLETLSAGNVGGISRVEPLFYGIAGFVRFTSTYYMILIKARAPVALVGGHYIYHCEETVLRAVTPATGTKSADEAKQKAAFLGVDLSKNFYFSYTYDLTHTLQHNLTTPSSTPMTPGNAFSSFNDKWVWNRHLLRPAFRASPATGKSSWVLPLIHGFVDQAKLSVFGRTVYITLIARRSRHFAGARFLKRGVNTEGYVANDVETEQIVSEALTTPFHFPFAPGGGHGKGDARGRKPNPRHTSFVQVRGSIPLYWSQESVNMSPKPPIELTVVDPYFSAAALHFDDLLGRYGGPITVLNLIKHHERQPRESKLLPEFKQCIDYLNQFLPAEKRIKYIAWDIAADNRQPDKDVIGILEDIAEEAMESTNFFHTGPEPTWYALNGDPSLPAYRSTPLLQSGVMRTNCIDCLDRTNAAQFVIAKAALGHQLHALGIIHHPRLPFDSDAVDLMTEMFHDHGDTVALQYGGSHLVNTMETYRKIGAWSSHSRDMIENLRRYYTNSFIDGDKQAAIDLFLGIESLPTLPDQQHSRRPLRSYRDWFTPSHIEPALQPEDAFVRLTQSGDADGNYWQSYYRPKLFTEFARHFAYKVNSTLKYNPVTPWADEKDISPFVPRKAVNPPIAASSRLNTGVAGGVRRWMSHRGRSKAIPRTRIQSQRIDETSPSPAPPISTTEAIVARLLNPTVDADETAEYESYISQFAHLSLSQDLSEKDAMLYRSNAALASGQERGLLGVDRVSLSVYGEAVKSARPGQELRGSEANAAKAVAGTGAGSGAGTGAGTGWETQSGEEKS